MLAYKSLDIIFQGELVDMANSPLISVRIPPETLARIDRLAQKLYPPRRAGKPPNRSQVILDAINQYLGQHEAMCIEIPIIAEPIDSEKLGDPLQLESVDYEQDNHRLQPYLEPSQNQPHPTDPPVREYIDWWFNYFSYMKKFSDTWFKSK
jgi:hypothetical protein